MKTLDQEVQIAIISEAGSTFRNYLLVTSKESRLGAKALAENAASVSQVFIDLCEKNLKGDVVEPGVRSTTVDIYQWSEHIPSLPTHSLYAWQRGELLLGQANNGWSSNVPAAMPISGCTLYKASAFVSTQSQQYTEVDWSGVSVVGIAYQGSKRI